MWNFINQMGCHDPKFAKGGYHHFHTFIGHGIPNLPEKQFAYLKNTTPSMSSRQEMQNYNTNTAREESLSDKNNSNLRLTHENMKMDMSNACNSKKKKRRRRRRRKKKNQNKNQTENVQEVVDQRDRHNSVAESEDSFVILFEGDIKEKMLSDDESETTEELYSSDSTLPPKKVRFAADNKLCEVHQMITWDYAYREARKGRWEELARDHDRFKNRISDTEAVIRHVFAANHRARIFNERFARDG